MQGKVKWKWVGLLGPVNAKKVPDNEVNLRSLWQNLNVAYIY